MSGTARSQSTDPFQMNRFHVVDTEGFLNMSTPAAGFNTCGSPEWVVGSVEYQEGIWLYRRKFPGESSFTPMTMTKGVVKNDTSFYRWIMGCAQGKAYRTNFIIKHFHRDDVSGLTDFSNAVPYREMHCLNAFPIRVKMGNDFDATAADCSIEDLELELEEFRLFINGVEVTA